MRRPIIVTLQVNGPHWRAYWRERTGRKRYKNLGRIDEITKAHALRGCRELEKRLNEGASLDGGNHTLKTWEAEYLANRASDLDERTVANMRHTFAHLRAHFGPTFRLDELTRQKAATFRPYLAKQQGRSGKLSKSTIATHIRRAGTIFGEAHKQDLIPFNPFDREKSAEPKVEKDWARVSRDDLRRVLEACPSEEWRIMFALCRLAGLRQGEALRLRWDDIDWGDPPTLTVRPEGGVVTTKQRTRTVPVEPDLYAMLLARFSNDDYRGALVIGRGKLGGNVERQARKIVERAGLTPWSKPLHTLRKNLVSDWQAQYPARAVDEWLGHSAGVSEKHYRKTDPETIRMVTGRPSPESSTAYPHGDQPAGA